MFALCVTHPRSYELNDSGENEIHTFVQHLLGEAAVCQALSLDAGNMAHDSEKTYKSLF